MRRNGTLAVTDAINGEPGLVIYGTSFDGLRSVRGQDGSGSEHLTLVE